MKRYVLAVISLGGLCGPVPVKAQSITEYLLPTAGASPAGIALGPDGNLWATEMTANKIAKINPSGAVTQYVVPTSNSQPAAITAGPDGNLWFTEFVGNNIGQITVNGVITEYAVPTFSAAPVGIVAGPDGRLWFVESSLSGNKVGAITTSGTIDEYPINDFADPFGIATGPDGRLWFTEPAAGKIGAITTAGAITEYPLIPASSAQSGLSPQGITQGPDGNLWFTGGGAIWSITISGVAVPYTVPTTTFRPAGIVTGPDGNLWFTDPIGNKVGALTTSGVFAEYPIPTPSAVPTNLAVGPDGNLWFTEEGASRIAKLVLSALPPVSGTLTVNPTSLSFTGYALGPTPPSQTLTVTSSSPVPFTATSSLTVSYPAWLQISPSGTLTTNQAITVTVNPGQIGEYGTYVGNISLISQSFTKIVPVTLTVTPPPTTGNISVSPSSLSFSTQGSAQSSQELIIQDATTGVRYAPVTISYNVVSPSGGNWLTLISGGGTPIPSGSADTAENAFTAKIDSSELGPGTYTATIVVAAIGGNTVTIPVTLTATAYPTVLSTTPGSLEFVWQVGGPAPPPQSFQVVESGTSAPFQVEVNGTNLISAVATGSSVAVSIYPYGVSTGTYVQPVSITLLPFSLAESTSVNVIVTAQSNQSNITRIVSSASLATGGLAPGEMIAIFGTNLGPSSPLNLALDSSGNVATSLGGVSVLIGGHPAPLIYVSDTQINCVVPYEIAQQVLLDTDIPVVVTYAGQQNTYTMSGGVAMPAVFTSNGSGGGPAAILNVSGGYNGPDNPAAAGSAIVLYITGEGQTIPAGVTGAVTQVNTAPGAFLTSIPELPLRVTIGGVQAPVTFFGEAPGVVSGVMQINAQIPAGLASGDLRLMVSLGGVSSQAGVTVSVK